MFGLNSLKWYFWVLLLAGFTINSFADLTDDEYRLLSSISSDTELIEYHTREIKSNTDNLESLSSYLSHLVDIDQSLGQIQSDVDVYFGWFDDSLNHIESDVDDLNEYVGYISNYTSSIDTTTKNIRSGITNILSQLQLAQKSDDQFRQWFTNNFPILTIENIESLLSTNNLQNAQFFDDWREFMDSEYSVLADYILSITDGQNGEGGLLQIDRTLKNFYNTYTSMIPSMFSDLMRYLSNNYNDLYLSPAITNGIISAIHQSGLTNSNYYADMGIVTNIYYNTQSLSNNVDFISNYISTNKVDIENPISQSESEANSLFSLNTSETFYTNKITKTVDLNPEEAPDFEPYTNVTDIVSSIDNNYQYKQFQSTTNQLISAISGVQDSVTTYLDNFKKSDLFTKKYNTRVELVEKGSIKDYPDFEFKFDFAEMKLPTIVTTFLTRLYDFLYLILCIWASIDIFQWAIDKFGD